MCVSVDVGVLSPNSRAAGCKLRQGSWVIPWKEDPLHRKPQTLLSELSTDQMRPTVLWNSSVLQSMDLNVDHIYRIPSQKPLDCSLTKIWALLPGPADACRGPSHPNIRTLSPPCNSPPPPQEEEGKLGCGQQGPQGRPPLSQLMVLMGRRSAELRAAGERGLTSLLLWDLPPPAEATAQRGKASVFKPFSLVVASVASVTSQTERAASRPCHC